jgi:hypothetical protein
VRVELKTEGGLGAFPGLSGTFACESQGLAGDDARRLAALVEASGVLAGAAGGLDLPAPIVRRGADRRRYVLTIHDGSLRQTVTAEDPLTPALAALVAFLRERQRAERAPGRAPRRNGRRRDGR